MEFAGGAVTVTVWRCVVTDWSEPSGTSESVTWNGPPEVRVTVSEAPVGVALKPVMAAIAVARCEATVGASAPPAAVTVTSSPAAPVRWATHESVDWNGATIVIVSSRAAPRRWPRFRPGPPSRTS